MMYCILSSVIVCCVFFFFSSRRRHTRYWRDWSSDVCSSDLREAQEAAERILADEQVGRLLRIGIDREVEESYRQVGPGRPGPNTEYRRVEASRYRIRFEEDAEALVREARGDGLFPLMSNDEDL